VVLVSMRNEDGAVAVVAAVLAVTLFVIAGLVLDLGLARDKRRQAQNSADAAALAGAGALFASGAVANKAAAVTAAKRYAEENYDIAPAEWATCTDTGRTGSFSTFVRSTQTDCVSFRSTGSRMEIRVVLPGREVETTFGKLVGVSRVAIGAAAHALGQPGGQAACGLCIIGPGAHDFQNGDVTVQGASIHVNGTLDNKNNSTVKATGAGSTIKLEDTDGDAGQGDYSPAPIFGQPPIADPLAFLSLPPPEMATLQPKTGSVCTSGPGIYRTLGSIGSTCNVQPGLYVVTGSNHYSGQTDITANGVTFYFTCQDTSTTQPRARTCNPGEDGGDLLMTGQASLTITPQTTGSLAGVSLVSDRNSTAEIGFRGNGVGTSSGTIYLKNGTLDYRGNGEGLVLDSLVVVKDLDFSGNPSAINLKYTQDSNVKMPAGDIHLSH
jgi:hypothetical protein